MPASLCVHFGAFSLSHPALTLTRWGFWDWVGQLAGAGAVGCAGSPDSTARQEIRKTTECTGFLRPPVASWQRTTEKTEHFPDANWVFAHLTYLKSEVSFFIFFIFYWSAVDFQRYRCTQQWISFTYTPHIHSFLDSSHIGHRRVLSRVPCATQEVLISYLFYVVACTRQSYPPNTGIDLGAVTLKREKVREWDPLEHRSFLHWVWSMPRATVNHQFTWKVLRNVLLSFLTLISKRMQLDHLWGGILIACGVMQEDRTASWAQNFSEYWCSQKL